MVAYLLYIIAKMYFEYGKGTISIYELCRLSSYINIRLFDGEKDIREKLEIIKKEGIIEIEEKERETFIKIKDREKLKKWLEEFEKFIKRTSEKSGIESSYKNAVDKALEEFMKTSKKEKSKENEALLVYNN